MPISDADGYIPPGTTVVSITTGTCPCTIQISQPASTAILSEGITFTGFYTVDVAGTHVAIDDHALLVGGYDDVRCGAPFVDGLQIKDSEIVSGVDEGIHLGSCANTRLIGDLISGNGTGYHYMSTLVPPLDGEGVSLTGQELTVATGVIEQSGGPGLLLNGAQQISVTGMYFDNNGKRIGGPAIDINASTYLSICGNHIHRSGGNTSPATTTSQVNFAGTSDNISLCGNVYFPDDNPDEATLKPSVVYDATPPVGGSAAILTNTHFYEQPSPQASGQVYSSIAAQLLAPLQVPQFTNEITGLTLSNSSPTTLTQIINIAAGTAADSTGTALIQLPPVAGSPACSVDIANGGAGGLDTGSGMVASGTTYNFFAIASAGGSNNGTAITSCIASTSLAPSFLYTGTAYALSTSAQTKSGATTLYNVPTVAGVKVGDLIVGTGFLAAGTTVTGVGTVTTYQVVTPYSAGVFTDCTVTGSAAPYYYNCFTTDGTTGTAGLFTGTEVSDNANNATANTSCSSTSGQSAIQNYAHIAKLESTGPSGVIKLNTSIQITLPTDCFTFSGGNTITISPAATSNAGTAQPITIYTGLYRMLGALYTPSGSTSLVPFIQNGDTFSLTTPVTDINTNTLGTFPIFYPLPSVPSGISVEAMGRCTGGANDVLLFTPPPVGTTYGPGTPTTFPAAPGFSVNLTTPNVSFPYRLFTNPSGQIKAVAANSSTYLYCVTDGWVWHRAQ